MSNFFIDRPIFAGVIAILIVLAGAIVLRTLPIAAYPQLTPPTVIVTATYPGATAEEVDQSVATPIEEQVNGAQDMLYMSSSSTNTGQMTLMVTFALSRDPDLAAVDVQNRLALAEPELPPEVLVQGVTVRKQSTSIVTLVALTSPGNVYDPTFLSNYASIHVVDPLARVQGVGNVQVFNERDYGMRIWVNPAQMATLGITASDVTNAIANQNIQAPAGQVGQPPAPSGQQQQLTVQVPGRLTTPQQFGDVIVRANPDGSLVHIKDIGQAELGSQLYSSFAAMNSQPAVMIGIFQLPTANALDVARAVSAQMKQLSATFPPGIQYEIPLDTTAFITASLLEVLITLGIAFCLVFVVVYIFLQNWRATLIPAIVVPVSLVGAIGSFALLHFSINTLTLFGLVLAIGLVVDDAIIVVEAVERHIQDEGVDSREAARRAMAEVSNPVVAIALVLSAVFVPVGFLGGITGQIYKQFALTLAVSVIISAFEALTLSPALCALLLRPTTAHRTILGRLFDWFNRGYAATERGYEDALRFLLRRKVIVWGGLLVIGGGMYLLFRLLPASFVPSEDQGYFIVDVELPGAAALDRTNAVSAQVQKDLLSIPGVQYVVSIGGFSFLSRTSASNVATMFVILRPWDQRTTRATQLEAILTRAQGDFASIPAAQIASFNPPPIPGVGAVGGFQFELESRTGTNVAALAAAAGKLIGEARKDPALAGAFTTFRANVPEVHLDVDRDKALTLGVPLTQVFNTLNTYLGGLYVNDFNQFGRVYHVIVQAQAPYRASVGDISQFFVRGTQGNTSRMIPLSTLVKASPITGSDVVDRYDMYDAVEIDGASRPGHSSGQAIAAMERLASSLPQGYGYEWTGLSYQEVTTHGQSAVVLGLAIVCVFLLLAALYESWSVPLAVILIVPLGIVGALAAEFFRGLPNDVYAQIGFVMVVGLSAKNAILIVEFAKMRHDAGVSIEDAALEGARIRLRPILMTSFAFIFGVLPLVIASGAGSAARHALGTSVFGGMIVATVLGVLFVPVYFGIVELLAEWQGRRRKTARMAAPLPARGRPE